MGIQMIKRASAVFAAAMLALTGCSGEDGDPGAPGAPGINGTDGADGADGATGPAGPTGPTGATGPQGPSGVAASTIESCAGCHGSSLAAKHALSNQVVVTPRCPPTSGSSWVACTDANPQVKVVNGGADVTITFNVKVDAANRVDFLNRAGGYKYTFDAAVPGGVRTSLAATDFTVASNGSGNYTATIPGAGTDLAAGTTFMVRVDTGRDVSPQATVIAHYQGAARSIVSDQACKNCHGEFVFSHINEITGLPEQHHGVNPAGVSACVICHNRTDSAESRLGTRSSTNPTGSGPGTRLMGYVHGIHNSHNMPDGVYSRNGSTSASSQFSIGFPGYMNNCSTCHDTQASLDYVNAKPVSWQTCMSCHDDWDGFSKTKVGGTQAGHRDFTLASQAALACATCHNSGAKNTVGAMHNRMPSGSGSTAVVPLATGRGGLLWNGKDQSIEEGKKIQVTITEVTAAGPGQPFSVKWTASNPLNGNAAYDPCNTNLDNGPVFFGLASGADGQSASNFSVLRAYAQGNDWVNAGLGTSPGQPGSISGPDAACGSNATCQAPSVNAANTTCTDNVATTTLPALDATTATKGVVALQGRPQVKFALDATTNRVIWTRAQTAVREFNVADGSAPTEQRRQIVSTEKCLACHNGSLYQHGGNRIDRVELCIMCHNPAANEMNVRVGMGVEATEAYDRKPGQTYDLRYMLHAIHSAGETNAPLVYYRSNGVYAFGSQAAIDALPNWPGAGTGLQVYGATAGTTRTHNEIVVHYPRPLNDCGACHVNGSEKKLPDPTKAVAVTTYDAGGTTYGDQLDDVLMGPSAASCMSCHQSGDAATQFGLRNHANQGGWAPTTFEQGRQTLIDAVK